MAARHGHGSNVAGAGSIRWPRAGLRKDRAGDAQACDSWISAPVTALERLAPTPVVWDTIRAGAEPPGVFWRP